MLPFSVRKNELFVVLKQGIMLQQTLIRKVVDEWYGIGNMPCRVLEKKEEIEEFENNHPEVPPNLWDLVNHNVRVWRMWCNDVVDIVLRRGNEFVLIQDVCYVADYPDVTSWHNAIGRLLRDEEEWWCVFHQGE